MVVFYQFDNCKGCQKVSEELDLADKAQFRDIKNEPVSSEELDRLQSKVGSYESLLSKKSVKFKMEGLHKQELTEDQYRELLLQEYTYFKRPILEIEDQVFLGSEDETIEAARKALG